MKKIVMCLFVAIVTNIVSANTILWEFEFADKDPLGGAFDTYTAYLFDSGTTDYSSTIAAIQNNDLSSLSTALFTSATEVDGNVGFIYQDGVGNVDPGSYSLYTVLINQDKSWFIYTDETLDLGLGTYGQLSANFLNTPNSQWTQIVPEPTSGLLLLVGGALLALRRKQR